jgi:GxxExxY protein
MLEKEKLKCYDTTSLLIGIGYEIHHYLGSGLLEIVYKDAFMYELKSKNILFEREKQYDIKYKDIILPHRFFADFVIDQNVILEIKAQEGGIADEQLAQTINYLKISGCPVGLIINFSKLKLQVKRVVY